MPIAKVRMVKGPARVVVDGTCQVLGIDVSSKTVKVRAGKALPFELAGRCRLRVRPGRGGRTWLADPSVAGTFMWREVARQISALAAGRKITVMLAGDTDTGKSTLSAYLANVALSRGLTPCVIDGDIGQGDLGPPAGIGAAVLSAPVIDLRDASARMFEFVGDISPAGLERLVAEKMRSILERAGPLGGICIINTDGYVRDAGVQYKLMLADELRPDAIVCLGENPALLEALGAGPWQVLRARASGQAYKTGLERASRRLDQFLRHVGRGSSAAELRQLKFAYAGMMFSQDLQRPPIKQLERENLKRMFVGLGSNGRVEGFGVVTGVTAGIIRVQTDVDRFDTVYLSNIQLCRGRSAEIRL